MEVLQISDVQAIATQGERRTVFEKKDAKDKLY